MIYKLLSFAATVHYFASSVSAETVDASSLTDKVLFGYQGWFDTPSAGSGWVHWSPGVTPGVRHYCLKFIFLTHLQLPMTVRSICGLKRRSLAMMLLIMELNYTIGRMEIPCHCMPPQKFKMFTFLG
jgi:hypothetical protein